MRRFLSPAFFAVAAICFFLPFVSVSCNPQGLEGLEGLGGEDAEGIPSEGFDISVTGWEIISNDVPEPEGLGDLGEGLEQTPAGDAAEDFPGRIHVILAFGVAVAGIALSLLAGKIGPIAATALGAAGLLFLFLFRSAISSEFAEAALFLEVSYKLGYWLVLVLFLAAGGVGVWRLVSERPTVATAPPPPGTEPPPGAMPPETPPPPP